VPQEANKWKMWQTLKNLLENYKCKSINNLYTASLGHGDSNVQVSLRHGAASGIRLSGGINFSFKRLLLQNH